MLALETRDGCNQKKLWNFEASTCPKISVRKKNAQEDIMDRVEERKLLWCDHLGKMSEKDGLEGY